MQSVGEIVRQQLQRLVMIHYIPDLTVVALQIMRICITARPNAGKDCVSSRRGEPLFQLFDLPINAATTCLSGYRSRPGIENCRDDFL